MTNSQPASLPDASATHNRLVAVVGATATGKTAAAIHLAQRFGGEIVSADSRQIYRGMTIGTAKATTADQAAAAHHLLDIREPDEAFSLAEYLDLARQAIADVLARGRLPLLVGGTGQYIYAVLEGWQTPNVPPQPALRAQFEAEGAARLHARLAAVDPIAAAKIGPRNTRRLARALEVWDVTGRTITSWQEKHPPAFKVLRLGLRLPREALRARVAARVDAMLEAGLVDEVAALLERGGAPETTPALNSIGYAEISAYLRGQCSLAEARERIITNTRHLARRQETWFRRDPTIAWVDASEPAAALATLEGLVAGFLAASTE